MITDMESTPLSSKRPYPLLRRQTGPAGRYAWIKVASLAAVSALAGGLAAAWFYRKTLAKLRQTDNQQPSFGVDNSEFGPEEDN